MQQPQSQEEIQFYIDELRRLDPLLDIVWDPRARIVQPGAYTAMGKRIDPTYDGRWAMIRYDSAELGHAGFNPERGWTLIVHVETYTRIDGVLAIMRDSDYEPVDGRVLELMRSGDSHNVQQFGAIRKKLWAQSDAIDAAENRIDEAMAREGLDRVHFKANYTGGVGNWQGKGANFAEMAEAAHIRNRVITILRSSNP